MNTITRLILRGLASGRVRLTPRVEHALKALSHDWPDLEAAISLSKNATRQARRAKQRRSGGSRITKL